MRSGIELSQFLRVFLPTLLSDKTLHTGLGSFGTSLCRCVRLYIIKTDTTKHNIVKPAYSQTCSPLFRDHILKSLDTKYSANEPVLRGHLS